MRQGVVCKNKFRAPRGSEIVEAVTIDLDVARRRQGQFIDAERARRRFRAMRANVIGTVLGAGPERQSGDACRCRNGGGGKQADQAG